MGAHNLEIVWPGELTRTQVAEKFKALVQEDLYLNGHDPYSGSWGTMEGLTFSPSPAKFAIHPRPETFASREAARDYVLKHTEKWGPALAVQFHAEHDRRPEGLYWLVGGWAAS